MKRTHAFALSLGLVLLCACSNDPTPRPKGYFRIDLPAKRYIPYKGGCGFDAEVPAYSVVTRRAADTLNKADMACRLELRFPDQNGEVYMTYRRIQNDLAELIEDAHAFKSKHEVMAGRIRNERVLRPDARVYGTMFNVDGNVASPMVFYMTDSVEHFLYGALYFQARPNADSLRPLVDRAREDLTQFAATLAWK